MVWTNAYGFTRLLSGNRSKMNLENSLLFLALIGPSFEIPSAMPLFQSLTFSNITKNALIIGMVNKIEIWDPVFLSNVDDSFNKIDSSQFDDLSDKIIL